MPCSSLILRKYTQILMSNSVQYLVFVQNNTFRELQYTVLMKIRINPVLYPHKETPNTEAVQRN